MCNTDTFVKWIPQTWFTVKSNHSFSKASQNRPIKCLRSFFTRLSILPTMTKSAQKPPNREEEKRSWGKKEGMSQGAKDGWRLTGSECRFKSEKSGVSKSGSCHGSGYIKKSGEWEEKGVGVHAENENESSTAHEAFALECQGHVTVNQVWKIRSNITACALESNGFTWRRRSASCC